MVISAHGPPIAGLIHKNKPVPSYLTTLSGQRLAFDRIAVDNKDGSTSLAQLRQDECMISPGLIYREEKAFAA